MKKIDNITTRAVNDIDEVAYLTDITDSLTAFNAAVGLTSSNGVWTIGFDDVTYVTDAATITDAITQLDSGVHTALETVDSALTALNGKIGTYATSGNYIDSAASDRPNILALDGSLYELSGKVDNLQTDAVVTLTSADGSDGIAKVYTIYQGGSDLNNKVGEINIPADMVVTGGEVKTVATADTPYTGAVVGDKYIELTIANATSDKIYIPVKDLVDVYTAGSNATQVQVAIDSSNVITATLVAGGVDTAELANSAVTSAKIADSAVETAKIADGAVVSAKIADSAVETVKIADDAVTSAKIADDAVVTANIVDANITTAKIADDAITGDKIAAGAVGTNEICLVDVHEGVDAWYTLRVDNGRLQLKEIANPNA